jgi:ATP-binding cassette, subfamily B, bacterial
MRELLRALGLMIAISWGADRWRSLAAVVTASGQTLFGVLGAAGMKVLVDGVVAANGAAALRGVLLVVGFAAIRRFMVWASFNVRMRLRENTQVHLDARLMALTAGIPGVEHHERPDYLDRMQLLHEERESLANPFNPLSWTLAAVVQTVGAVGLLFAVHPLLALLPLFGLPTLFASRLTERASAALRERQAERRRMADHLVDLTTGAGAAKEVRVFGLAGALVARHRALVAALDGEELRLEVRNTALTSLAWTLFAAGYLGALALAVSLAAGGAASVGAVVLVLSLGARVNDQVSELAGHAAWLVRTHRAVRRLTWLMDYAAAEHVRFQPRTPAALPERLTRGIRLEGVSFAYPGTERVVLEEVDLFLPAGTTVAVVGDNGAGKTTLVKLLCRLYEPTRGRITVDDLDLRDVHLDAWRARLSAGFQDFARLQLLARESIGVGDAPHIPHDPDLLAALDRAAASTLPAALPRRFDTQLGRDFTGGVELSLGQWQKVALGRAMMRPAPLLLVLDEPTASLDAPTEHALFERFAGAAQHAAARAGAITLLVSHRFSTVRMADLILVVAGGRIQEAGDHAALLKAGGLYAQLYELQARAYR